MGVVLRAPVMSRNAIFCTFPNLYVVPTEPLLFLVPTSRIGVYHSSSPYSIFGSTTDV